MRRALFFAIPVMALALTGCPSKPKDGTCKSSEDCAEQEGFGKVCVEGRCQEAPGAIPVRALGVLYSNFMHFVALEGSGIKSMADLRGKRVSTGAPGSGTEVKALRVLESYGINPRKILKESV